MSFWSSWSDVLPTGNVCMGSPILMTSVHDIAVGNEWQPRDANGFFLTTAVWPRLSERSSGGVASLLLPVLVPHAFCTSGVPCAPLLRLWHQAHLRMCRLLDIFHHRAACANVGVSGRRGFALESVAARVCREAGGRVSVNQYVRDLDTAPNNRRLEVVADGLFLFHGAQLVIDTMMVSPLSFQGYLMRGVLVSMGQRPWQHEGGSSDATLSSPVRVDERGWWSLCVRLEGDSPRNVATSSARCPSLKHGTSHSCSNSGCATPGFTVEGRSWRAAGLVG